MVLISDWFSGNTFFFSCSLPQSIWVYLMYAPLLIAFSAPLWFSLEIRFLGIWWGIEKYKKNQAVQGRRLEILVMQGGRLMCGTGSLLFHYTVFVSTSRGSETLLRWDSNTHTVLILWIFFVSQHLFWGTKLMKFRCYSTRCFTFCASFNLPCILSVLPNWRRSVTSVHVFLHALVFKRFYGIVCFSLQNQIRLFPLTQHFYLVQILSKAPYIVMFLMLNWHSSVCAYIRKNIHIATYKKGITAKYASWSYRYSHF